MVTRRSVGSNDSGSILVLTLILVTVMSIIVIGLTQFVTVTLRTADVASERTETNFDSANVMHWAIEQLAKKRIRITDSPTGSDCADAPAYSELSIPPGLASNGSTTTLECRRTNPINGEPVVHLRAQSIGDQQRLIEATVEVPEYSHGARVADWRVDIPIAVPPYTTTTTSTTSTTVATNTPPVAADMSVSVGIDDPPYLLALPVTDTEGDAMTVSSITPSGSEITVAVAGGTSVNVSATTAGGAVVTTSYTFTYTVDDGQPSNLGTVTVIVDPNMTPPSTSTTTTLPPNALPACDFVITSSQSGGSAGIGVLTVSNSGADFTGWQIRLTQKDSAKPWQFTWGAGVTATVDPAVVNVSGTQLITQSSPFSVSADLVHNSSGQPKIAVNETLTCTVVAP